MWEFRQEIGALAIVLAFQAVLSLPVFWMMFRRRRRFQFTLRTILLWGFPLVAIVAWILSWDGPMFSRRTVVTDKVGALVLLESVCIPFFFFRWLNAIARQPVGDSFAVSAPGTTIAEGAEDVSSKTET
jgi:hypothetical protein